MLVISAKTLRTVERVVHLVMGIGLLALAFTPLGQADAGIILRPVIAPAFIISGLLMWQHARVTRALRSGRLPIRLS